MKKQLENTSKKAAPENISEKTPQHKKGFFHILWKIFKYSFLSILLIIVLAAGFVWWTLGTESGQAWLVKNVNAALGPKPDKDGLTVEITSLSGSLPFDFKMGVSLGDKNGVWLDAPQNEFTLNWKELPKVVRITNLQLANADLQRFPDLPPSPPKEPSPPFTLDDFKNLLVEANAFLQKKPWWLPQIYLDNISVENFRLPADIFPQKNEASRLAANLKLNASLIDGKIKAVLHSNATNANREPVNLGAFALSGLLAQLDLAAESLTEGLKAETDVKFFIDQPVLDIKDIPGDLLGANSNLNLKILAFAAQDGQKMNLNISGPDLSASAINIKTDGFWQSGSEWKNGELDGAASLDILAKLTPPAEIAQTSPLAMIKQPVELNINAKGELPRVSVGINLDGSEFQIDKYSLADLHIKLQSGELDIPMTKAGLEALANENQIVTSISGILDREKINLAGNVFVQALLDDKKTDEARGWRAGIRNLVLSGLDLAFQGDVAAILENGQSPALDGEITAQIGNWRGINQFLGGQKGSGNVKLDVRLVSGLENNPLQKMPSSTAIRNNGKITQNAFVNLAASNLRLTPPQGKGYGATKLNLAAEAENIFDELSFKINLEADRVQAENMTINAKSAVSGKLQGPITANVQANGDVRTSLNATWSPGKILLNKLDFGMNAATLLPDAKKAPEIGISMGQQATITYGDQGLSVSGLDVKITPSGRLQARGGLSRDKLDLTLNLSRLDFKPWQALVSAIPTGSADIELRLSGTPQKPGGNFRASLRQVKIPKAPLAPISLNINGGLKAVSGSNSLFGVQVEVDKSTLKALGANIANLSAGIPIKFKENGVPEISMNDAMNARIRWDGALGPLWNLVPLADQRVNGRLAINLDASGTLKKPKIRGGINIDQGRYANIQYGVLLTDIFLKLNLSDRGTVQKIGDIEVPGGITLEAGVSDGHKGNVRINGRVDIDGKNLDMKLKMDRLKPLRRRDIHVEISGDLTAAGELAAPNVKGEIIINRGEILLDNLTMTGSVTTLDITEMPIKKVSEVSEKPAPVGNLDIAIRMLPRFRVDGRGLSSVWQANLLVQGPLNNPSITGSVNAASGNFDFLGKIFELTKGTVTFAGGSLSNPLLDIELTNETPDLTAHIMVVGPVNKMRLVLTSEPQVPRDEILSRVLFGKSINDLSRLEALQLAAAVAQLAGFGGGGGITSFAKKALGIDVLRIGTSSSGSAGEEDSGAGGTTIEAGKYITDQLYLGVQQGMKPDSTAFIIQFELTSRTSLEVISESSSTWGGLNWKYNY